MCVCVCVCVCMDFGRTPGLEASSTKSRSIFETTAPRFRKAIVCCEVQGVPFGNTSMSRIRPYCAATCKAPRWPECILVQMAERRTGNGKC